MRMDQPRWRRTAWCAVIGYLLVASGLPLPSGAVPSAGGAAAKRLPVKDRGRPFPCMDKPCGCATAEQCFTSCCCNTPAQLLAWAKARRVEAAVVTALARRAAAAQVASGRTPRKPAAGCCSAAAEPACCAASASAPACCQPPPEPAAAEPEAVSTHTVVLRALLACGGILGDWLAVAAALPPPPVSICDRTADPLASLPIGDEFSLAERAAPALPPPRAT